MNSAAQFRSFAEFYPYYLGEHSNPTCRRLHFVGTSLVIALLAYAIGSGKWLLLLAVPLCGYGFAWVGHFFFEKNRPATFTYPLYSLIGDFAMFRDILLRRISL
ncbi:Mpo1-like protein [Pseudomonas putida]